MSIDTAKVLNLQGQLTVILAKLGSAPETHPVRAVPLNAKSIECDQLRFRLRASAAAISRPEGAIFYFAERVCTSYTSMICAHAFSYHDFFNALLSNGKWEGKCFGCFCCRGSEDGYSHNLEDADSDEEGGQYTLPPEVPPLVFLEFCLQLLAALR